MLLLIGEEWQSIPIFLPGKSHGQRSLAGCNTWGHKELASTWPLRMHTCYYKWLNSADLMVFFLLKYNKHNIICYRCTV